MYLVFITWNRVEGSCISGNQKKGTTFIRKPDNKKGTLLLSSYAIYGRMLLTWLLFRSRAPVVVLGSKLRLPMSSSWPVFPGLDQALFPPWFSWFLGFDSKTVQRSALRRSRREPSTDRSTCTVWLRHRRERAPQRLKARALGTLNVHFEISKSPGRARRR